MSEIDRWIPTYVGKAMWPFAPHPDQIDLLDIAHHLSMKCRYNGATRSFMSVAQHSVMVSQRTPDKRWGLMHDAAETYLPDVSSPIKDALYFQVNGEMVEFSAVEDVILKVIAEKFDLPWPVPATVKKADLEARSTEKRDLLAPPPREWLAKWHAEPWEERIVPLQPMEARALFLSRAKELGMEV